MVAAARHPQHGADRVAQVILQLARHRPDGMTLAMREVNGEPAVVASWADGEVDSVWVLHVADDRIAGIAVVRNPQKLGQFASRSGSPTARRP